MASGRTAGTWTCMECQSVNDQGTWVCKGKIRDGGRGWKNCSMTWRKHQQRQADDKRREREKSSFRAEVK
eukprot:8829436-Pyramimonas_sp.AAC.1